MRKLFIAVIASVLFFIADAQIKTPAPSPPQTIKQDFGLAAIELSYSRPGVKGRKIFGDLVPYGKVWRTGANNATTITFGDDVIIDGTKIPAGVTVGSPRNMRQSLQSERESNHAGGPAGWKQFITAWVRKTIVVAE